ncbi:tetratricopeptide repeat protein [Alcanivorax sediminis]|uniref:Tetratricopeptide repeat protein n=1 Tax=Alcanivorax sediminis TaxID=2663008 RepID=A0A6N7LUE6_9GAMM|nr:tetratricopeptide repeat protein [Alcanivorax sediminis]MQX52986.1 tetratricopeptide repeat protein [Alcanivorax sediminis]
MRYMLSVMMMAVLLGCASTSEVEDAELDVQTPEASYAEGEAARQRGDYGGALSSFLPLVEREDRWGIRGKLAIAKLTLDSGQNREALNAYTVLLEEDPALIEAQEGKGLALLGLGEVEAAREQLLATNTSEASRWRTLNGLGIASDMDTDYDAAARWYGMALESGGDNPLVINNAAYSRIMAGDYSAAEKLLQRALVRYPEEDRLRNNLAIAQARQGNYRRAISTWERSLDAAEARNNAGYIAYLNGDLERAKKLFREASDMSPRYNPGIARNLELVGE